MQRPQPLQFSRFTTAAGSGALRASQGSAASSSVEPSTSAHSSGGRGGVHERVQEEHEPVDGHSGRHRARIPACLRRHGQREGEGEQEAERTEREPARHHRRRLAETLHVHPHAGEQRERQADVQEHEEGKEAIGDLLRAEEVARHRLDAEPRAVEPLGGGERRELRARVPHQPVADDARRRTSATRAARPKSRKRRGSRESARPAARAAMCASTTMTNASAA